MLTPEVVAKGFEVATKQPEWTTYAPIASAIFGGGMLLVAIWNAWRARKAEEREAEAKKQLASAHDKEFSRLYLATKQMKVCLALAEDLHYVLFPKGAESSNEGVDPQVLAMRIGRVWAACRAGVTILVGALSQIEGKLTPEQNKMLRNDPELNGYLKDALQGVMLGADFRSSTKDADDDPQAPAEGTDKRPGCSEAGLN